VPESARVALVGVGNNASALVQGVQYYRVRIRHGHSEQLPGIRRPVIDGLSVADVEFVAAFDIAASKVGRVLSEAIFAEPNNYRRLDVVLPTPGVVVAPGIADDTGDAAMERVAATLVASGAEVLLHAIPAGRQQAATAYAEAALRAGVAFINTTPDIVARDAGMMDRFVAARLPLIGDDLVSHFGTSIVHSTLLRLLAERGLTLASSYQINLGGNQDFKNLAERATGKRQSKLNALSADAATRDRVHLMPFGYLPELGDQKVAHVNIEGVGWGGAPVGLDVTLRVYDSSGAAGVTIDLIRLAAGARRSSVGGFVAGADGLLKSPPGSAV
jgi:myo-inositol-1-phosphate synthase